MRALPIFLMLALMGAPHVQAESYGPTELEKAALPPYCGGPGGGGIDWRKRFGEAFIWNNHTCYGINRINRYFRTTDKSQRQFHLRTAMQDFDYSIGHLPENFPLMPEIYYYRGLVFKLQGVHPRAMADWQKSISMDKHYVKSIVDLADLYGREMKKPDQALELATEGLRDNPDSKALKARYTRYGGKPPFPEPRVLPKADGVSKEGESASSQAKPADDTSKQVDKPADTPQTSAVQTTPVAGEKADPAVIGIPSNPWCRFCPVPAPAKDPAPSTP